MDPFADISDVESIWRPLTDAERVMVLSRIEQASQLVRDEVPTVDDRIASGDLSANTVRFIVRDMVFRLVSHPAFVRQSSAAIDDGSESNTYDSSVSRGVMFIEETELRRLTGARTSAASFSITPSY
jgi:hypothetical protein